MIKKIKKDDKVLVISGKDRGKKGKVLRVLPSLEKAIVEGVNIRKKHIRPKREGEKGQVVEFAAPIHISNLQLVCNNCQQPTRVGYRLVDKKKIRICKKCKVEI